MILSLMKKSQDGSLLLMSLLILASILASASSVGVLTMQNLRVAIAVDHGILAGYAAESGLEDGLFEIRKNETAAASLPASGTLSNNSRWSRAVTAAAAVMSRPTLAANDVWQIDLYDPDSSLSALGSPIKSVTVSWSGSGAEWVEAEVAPWQTNGALGTPSTQLFSAASNPAIVNLQDSTAVMYRLRIKALYADLTNLTITAYSELNGSGAVVNLPAQITMISTGSFVRAQQAARATMPQRSPLSGVFGYVLFSEEDLIKE